jgi:hypothetical protein
MTCHNCEEKWHFTITCPNPCMPPPLPLSAMASPNLKRGPMLAKATMTCHNCGQVGHFINRCPNWRQLSTPTQVVAPTPNCDGNSTPTQANQSVARTMTYRKCYNYGQKCHLANICPNPRYHPNQSLTATSTPYCNAKPITSTAKQNSMRGRVNQVTMQGDRNSQGMEIGTSLIHSNLLFTLVPYLFSFLL